MARRPNRLLTDALREIRKTISRFLSLFLLSALAVAFLAGLRTTAPDMEYTADAYYDAHGLMDLHVLSTLGLTQADIDALSAVAGVARAEGAYTADALLHLEENDLILKLLSLSDTGINAPRLRDGRLPEHAGECLVEPGLLSKSGLSLGDTLTLDTGEGSFQDALVTDAFTIVGTADSPLYISVDRGSSSLGSGRVTAFVLLPEDAFCMEAYTDAYLLAEGAQPLLCYGGEYAELIDALTGRLESLADERAALRYDAVIDDATRQLEDAQRDYDAAEAKAMRELADAAHELEDARRELDDGWSAYEDGLDALRQGTADARRQIAEAEARLPDALAELEQGEADYRAGRQTLEEGRSEYAQGAADWASGKRSYDDGLSQLLDGEAEYTANYHTLTDAQAEYDAGWSAYLDGLEELEAAARTLSAAKEQLEQAAAQLAEGDSSYAEGAAQLEQLRTLYDALLPLYDAQLDALTGLLTRIDPSLTPESSDAEIAQAVTRWLDESLTEENAQACVEELQSWVSGLPPEVLDQVPGEVLDYIRSLTGDDLLSTKETAKEHMLEAVGQARAAELAAREQLDALSAGIAQGERQLADGSDAMAAGREQYAEGKRQYAEGLAQFNDATLQAQEAKKTLDSARSDLEKGWRQLEAGRRTLENAREELEGAETELEDGARALEAARKELEDGEAELLDARLKLDDGWQSYREGLAALDDAKRMLPVETADAQAELEKARKTLEDGEAAYADGLRSYEDGKTTAAESLSDAKGQLNDARRAVRDIEHCRWYLLSRETNMGYVSFQQDAQRMGNLSSVFPLIFFLVAALVCLTTMTRMVEEQRVEIGGMKALGYGKWAISLKYVGYGFLASFLGGLTGLVLGCALIPWIIFNAWKILYTVGELIIPLSPTVSLLALLAAVLCVTGTAFAACFATLASVPAELMRPRAPKPGKRVLLERIRPLWSHLGFTWKVTARNLFRYKKRFWMTVVGIGGCTALLVTGFGLRDSIYDILNKQFDEISTYSSQVGLVDGVLEDERGEIIRALEENPNVAAWMPVSNTSLTVIGPKRSVDASLFAVEEEEKFESFLHLRHRLDGEAVSLPDDGVILTEKLADLLGVSVGDSITLDGEKRVDARVSGITENYVFHYVYLTGDVYARLFGTPPGSNTILVRYSEDTKEVSDAVSSSLIPLSGVTSVSRIRDSRDTFAKSMESVDYAVILITVCAAALAFVVLYNLTNINITERLRELATLKVLGFYPQELSAYVYRENIFLTLFGVLFGLAGGKFLHQWLVLTVEIEMVMFGRTARPASYLYAVALTVLFSLLVNLAARLRLKKIDMVESLKTVD